MKSLSKFLMYGWLVSACLSLLAYFTLGFNFDKLIIVMLELLLAQYNYKDYKRGE